MENSGVKRVRCPIGHWARVDVVRTPIFENKVIGIDDDGTMVVGVSHVVGYREPSILICRTRGCYTEFPILDGVKMRTSDPAQY